MRRSSSAPDALFLAEYSGMNVAQISKLRRELDNVGGEFKVAKNTLLKIAAAGTQAEALKDQFTGPNAMIYSYKDPVGVAKVLAAVAKDMPKLKLKAGLLGTQRLSPQEIATLATIPPKDVLVGEAPRAHARSAPEARRRPFRQSHAAYADTERDQNPKRRNYKGG